MTTTRSAFLPLFLPPSDALTGSFSALETATRQALSALAEAQVRRVVMVDSSWRSPTLGVCRPAGAASSRLVEALCRQLADRDFWPGRADPAWEQAGRHQLSRCGYEAPDVLVTVGVPPHTPDRAMAVGEAIAAACAEEPGRTALLVSGAVTRSGHLSATGPLAFEQALRQLLEQGAGPEILNVGAELWINGHPDAELGHLFVLMGAAPGYLGTYLAECRAEAATYAVISFAPMPMRSAAPRVAPPTIFPLTLKGESPSA